MPPGHQNVLGAISFWFVAPKNQTTQQKIEVLFSIFSYKSAVFNPKRMDDNIKWNGVLILLI